MKTLNLLLFFEEGEFKLDINVLLGLPLKNLSLHVIADEIDVLFTRSKSKKIIWKELVSLNIINVRNYALFLKDMIFPKLESFSYKDCSITNMEIEKFLEKTKENLKYFGCCYFSGGLTG